MSRSANEVLLRMLQRLVKCMTAVFVLFCVASKQKTFHNETLGDRNEKGMGFFRERRFFLDWNFFFRLEFFFKIAGSVRI